MIFVYLLFCIIIRLVNPFEISCSGNINHASCTAEADPGLFILSQFWIPSQRTHWTIHGLWANYCNGSWGDNCLMNTLPTKNITKLLLDNRRADLIDSMLHYWNPDEDRNELWVHEIQNHSGCMNTIRPLCYDDNPVQGLVDYFDITVQLYLKYPIFDVLKTHGVMPGNYYPSAKIRTIISDKWNTTISLQCEENALSEIYFYFYAVGPLSRVDFKSAQFHANDTCDGIVFYPIQRNTLGQK